MFVLECLKGDVRVCEFVCVCESGHVLTFDCMSLCSFVFACGFFW